jgi:IclR family acetate operon transcriptional repressor
LEALGVEVRSVSKAIRLLETLAREPGLFGVSDLARQLSMDKASVSRMLRTLEQVGFVTQEPVTLRYGLGLRIGVLGHTALRRIDVRRAARPFIEKLALETGECAHVAILVDGRAFYIDQAQPDRVVAVDAPVGTLAPLFCTALGKALLAFQPEKEQRSLIASIKFEPYTRRTITDATALETHLASVRSRGIAVDDEEFSVGVRCIAAPVFRYDGTICGAIGVSGPSPRVTDDRLLAWEILMREQACMLSRELGAEPSPLDAVAENAI